MALEDAARKFQRGILDNYNMDETECTASNFMQNSPGLRQAIDPASPKGEFRTL